MSFALRLSTSSRAHSIRSLPCSTNLPNNIYGRTAVYQRIASRGCDSKIRWLSTSQGRIFLHSIRTKPFDFRQRDLKSRSNAFSICHHQFQEHRQNEETRDRPRQKDPAYSADGEGKESSSDAKPEDSSRQQSDPSSDRGGAREGEGEGEKQEKREEPPPPPPHGNKSPWQVFTETLQSEFKASKEWNESTKAIASSAHQFTENESIRRARAAYTAASGAASSTTTKTLKSTGKALGQGAAWTWDTSVVKGLRSGVNATGRGIEKATRPVRETQVYKTAVGGVKDVIDDGSSSRYGGWVEKEERRKNRELREKIEETGSGRPRKKVEKMEEDPNAGTNVTLHKDSRWKEQWRDFRDSNRVMQSLFTLKSNFNESENPFVSTARSITDKIAGFFAENETAMVIKKFREMDPTFSLEPFLREMREYILPEVLDAYVKGDVETLKLWLSTAQFQVYAALAQQYTSAGLKSDGRILDIRHVDILSARILEPGDVPVFIITCRTQEVHVYRNSKTNDLAAGMEDKVQLVTYAIGVTRIAEDVNNPDTRGWRLIELQKSARDYI